jgi:hypothetical protein
LAKRPIDVPRHTTITATANTNNNTAAAKYSIRARTAWEIGDLRVRRADTGALRMPRGPSHPQAVQGMEQQNDSAG